MRIHPRSPAVAFVLALALVAQAEELKPYPDCNQQAGDPNVTGAKAAFDAGNVSFNEADYPRAILYWEDAFRRDCTLSSMLLNLARAYELNGQKPQAVLALETFLQREPNSSEKGQISRRIEVLKKQMESGPPPVASAAPSATAPAISSAPTPPPEQPPTPQTSKGFPTFPVVVIGIGGAISIIGGLAFLGASSDVKRYQSHCEDPEKRTGCPTKEIPLANKARSNQSTAGVVTLLGLPVIAGGIIWAVVASSSSDTATTHVTPAVGQNFVGLSVDSKF